MTFGINPWSQKQGPLQVSGADLVSGRSRFAQTLESNEQWRADDHRGKS
jgi:hypothetical protein